MHVWRYSILMIAFTAILGLSPCSVAQKLPATGKETSAAAAGHIPPPKSWEVRTEQFETVINDVFYVAALEP